MTAETSAFLTGAFAGIIVGAPLGMLAMSLFVLSGRISRQEEEREWKEWPERTSEH